MKHGKASFYYVHILKSETDINSKQLLQILENACGYDREEGQNLIKT